MKSLTQKCLLAAATLAAAGIANAQEVKESITVDAERPAYVLADGMEDYLAREVEWQAAKGLLALHHYAFRTRMVHALYLRDHLVTREQALLAQREGQNLTLFAIAQTD